MKTTFRVSPVGLWCRYFTNKVVGTVLLSTSLLLVLPQVAAAADYSVCKLPAICDFQSPEAAVNDPAIVDGDTIDVVGDTYVLAATLQVSNQITILANNSIFDANGIRAIDVTGAATNLSISNVTIRNGQAPVATGGGALRVSGGAVVTIINGAFENNGAEFGGAIHNSGSTVQINVAVFSGNRASAGEGGAILTDSGGITSLNRVEIDGNQASLAGGGAAVLDTGSVLNVLGTTISNNISLSATQTVSNLINNGTTVSCGGSGISGQTFLADAEALSSFDLFIRLNGGDNTVIPNDLNIAAVVRQGGMAGPVIATAVAFAPGGVWPGGSDQTLSYQLSPAVALVPGEIYALETSIAGAYSIYISSVDTDEYFNGGQYCDSSFSPDWDYVFRTFGGTPDDGSGISSSNSGFAGLFNSTVSTNIGDGVTASNGGSVDMEFATIANNSRDGLVAVGDAPNGQISFEASLIASNGGFDCNGSDFSSNGFNLVGDNSNCVFSASTGDQIGTPGSPIDPLLGPLQNNGGSTSTHAIDETSPAIDSAGADGALPCSDASADQRDVARPNGSACDIGAFEFVPPLQSLIDAVAAFSIVDVPAGTYNESIIIGDGKTLRHTGPGTTVIDASGLNTSAITATGDFTLQGITVSNGDASGSGGGIFANVAGTDITLIDVLMTGNSATTDGGAIFLSNGTLTTDNVRFISNDAGGSGGAIFAGAITTMNISASLFDLNTAISSGGAIFSGGDLNIIDTTIQRGVASAGGGVFNVGTLVISNSTLSNNDANIAQSTAGGAIASAGILEIQNTTISGNSAPNGHGGGIGVISGSAVLNNITLAFNAAPAGLGGAFFTDFAGIMVLKNSLLSDNVGGQTNCGSLVSVGYNLFQTAPCPANGTDPRDIIADPLINGLANNGGLTETHSLQSLSPARNAGFPIPVFTQFDVSNLSLLETQGFTSLDTGDLLLAAGTFNVGSAFVSEPIDPGRNFSAMFEFKIVADAGGAADGFTFTLSDDPTVLGAAGGFLGIAIPDPIEPSPAVRGVVNGVSIEFDTWLNGQAEGANDPDEDHIGIDINGSLSSVVLTSFGSHGVLSDGNVWTAWVDYEAISNTLEVRAANDGIRPLSPTVSAVVDIAALTGSQAYVGFTGATGSSGISGEQRILSLSFVSSCEPDDQRGDLRPKGAVCDIGAFEAAATPATLGSVTLSTVNVDQDALDDGTSYPGVVDVPIIDIPLDKLTGNSFNTPESAPLGSFPLGSFPLGSFDLRTSPLGSFPLGSFPLGSFPLGSFPLGSFPLSSIPLQSAGGWTEILNSIPELQGAPIQTISFEQLLRLDPLPDSVASIALRDLDIQGSPLASMSLPGLSLGTTSVRKLNEWAENAFPAGDPDNTLNICATLKEADSSFTDCNDEDTLLGLEMEGAPVSALTIQSSPLGSFDLKGFPLASFPLGSFQIEGLPLGSFPLGSFPLGSFPLGSFPLGSFPLGSFPLGSFPLGSFPLGSFPLGSFPLGSFNMLAAPLGSFPLGSFPLGSFPLGSFEIDGKSFCEFYDAQALADGSSTCTDLTISPDRDSLADLIYALQDEADRNDDKSSGIASTPLGSFPLGSFDISSLPLGSFNLESLSELPVSLITLGTVNVEGSDGCTLIADNSTDTCSALGLDDSSSLSDLAGAYGGSLASSPLGSFPLGSFGIADLPLGSFPLGSFEINDAPLGSFPLGSFDLVGSPLGSFPLGSFSSLDLIINPEVPCEACENLDKAVLADAVLAGAILDSAVLFDLRLSTAFATAKLGDVFTAMTLAVLHGPGTLADIEDTGNLTLGQLLIAMMLKTDFPWETIPLAQIDAQEYSADNFVAYLVDFDLSGSESAVVTVEVTLDQGFLYVRDSASLIVQRPIALTSAATADPDIIDNGDGTQTLTFNISAGGFGFTGNTLRFVAVPAVELGEFQASATLQLDSDAAVIADNSNAAVNIVPDPRTDKPNSEFLPTSPEDVLLLGFISTPDDNDFYRVAASKKGERVAVFMSSPQNANDTDLIMYAPVSAVEETGQTVKSAALDSIPFEDDGIDYQGNLWEEPNALEDVNLLPTLALASISTNRGAADEAVAVVAADNAPYTIQVSGYNGAVSKQPYSLRVKVTQQVPNPECTPRSWTGDAVSTVATAGSWLPNTNAVFLVNGNRLASSEGDDATAVEGADAALEAINRLIHAPGIINGVVIDVSTIYGVDYGPWDENPCDVDAANDIVNAITTYLEEQRLVSPRLTYVTIVGSDEIIPFARKPDETSISNESTFAHEFSDNAMFGALITRHILSDDTYGDIDPIPWFDRFLNIPELAVGRLVESSGDIRIAAENYITFEGVLDPRTTLSAGYDFIADAAEHINDTFELYSSAFKYTVESPLIDQPGVDPSKAWTRQDFLDSTSLNSPHPVEQVAFNMHFNFSEALPSSGDAGGNYSDNLFTTNDLGSTDLAGGIWFTVGCHSGSNLPDVSVIGSAPGDDWAQSFSHLGALFLGQNGYGLGDTVAIALSERLLALFTENLNGTMSVGQAHAFAKQQYFADLGLYGEYDYKALQTATLFGLPMYQYGRQKVARARSPLGSFSFDFDSGFELLSATWLVPDTNITQTTSSKGEVFSVDGDVQFVHYRPLQPIIRRDVTGPENQDASGAFMTSLVTQDLKVEDIAFARPVVGVGENEPEIQTDEVVFPTAFTNIANYKAPPADGGPFEPRQQLNVIVGQFTSTQMDQPGSGTERLFRSVDLQIFYRPSSTVTPFDDVRPEFDKVQASVVGSSGAQQAVFSVDVSDENEVLRVAVLYLQSVSGSLPMGNWTLVDLTKGNGNNWTGGGSVDISGTTDGEVDYMLQAVDSNGNVANSTFKGVFYTAGKEPPAPLPGDNPGTIGVTVKADGEEVDPNDWIDSSPVDIEITHDPDISYVFSVDFAPFELLTSAGFQVSGEGVHTVRVQQTDGSNLVTFVILIDTTAPEILLSRPAQGELILQGQAPAASYDCRDAGSGVSTCNGTVADGIAVPTTATGVQYFAVSAQDFAHQNIDPPNPVMAENSYYVVQALEVNGPANPTAIGRSVVIRASATDLPDFVESASIDWGDGSAPQSVDLGSMSLEDISANHSYFYPGNYRVTVSVEYDAQHTLVGVLDSVLVYDTRGGFVTGAGWIDSPASAYTPNDSSDPFIVSKAHFKFLSKYKNGQSKPTGSTNFRFVANDLEFNATSYDWMLVSGFRARYLGEGTVSGESSVYKFMITVIDAETSESVITQDGFRIKIWREQSDGSDFVLYDSGVGADEASGNGGTTTLGGGSVIIHSSGKKSK